MSDNRRVAIVGCGAIAPIHLAALKACGIIPVALCDTVEEKAISLAKRFDVSSRFYTDYSEMLRKEKLDVVHICTPHFLHAPMVVEARCDLVKLIHWAIGIVGGCFFRNSLLFASGIFGYDSPNQKAVIGEKHDGAKHGETKGKNANCVIFFVYSIQIMA